MRPTKLVVAGLHSYRDPVTVDFEELGRHGLFGIFGPIGSGKSTLLDAMTLALYGLVDRVNTRSRQGLVNLGSQRCEVKLQFSIDSAQRRQHFEVQRAYRLKDHTAQRTLSRLVEYTPTGAAVIADKERDVNEAIVELVGLGPEDFMRAVVLPQGKFLELLHLKGSERRQMLQRVFRLHAYGGKLRRQIAARQQAADQAIAAVRGELRGLGEANEEGLARARRVAEQAAARRRTAQRVVESRRDASERTRRLRQEHARLADARRELEAHRAADTEIAALEAQLAAARALEPLVAPIERWTRAREHHQTCLHEHEEALASAVDREREWAAARDAASAVEREDAVRRPPWMQRSQELDALAAMAEARAELERQVAEAREARVASEAAIRSADGALNDAEARLASFEDKRRAVRRKLRLRRVRAEEREQALATAEAADRLERARTSAEQARATVDELRERETAALDVREAAEEALATAERAVQEHEAEAARLDAEPVAALEPAALRRHVGLQDQLRAAEERERSARAWLAEAADRHAAATAAAAAASARVQEARAAGDRSRARHLARSLEPDRPCPVCGSLDHPAPPGSRREGPVPEIELDDAEAQHVAAVAALGATTEELSSADRGVEVARAEAEQALGAFEAMGSGVDARGRLASRHAWDVARAAVRERLHDAAMAVERARGPLTLAVAREADVAEARRSAEERLEAARQAEEAAWEGFHARRGELTLFDVRNALIAIASRDREAEALQRELDELDSAWQSAAQARDARRADRDRANAELLRLDERIALLEARRPSLGPPPFDVAAARAEVKQALDTLDRALLVAKQAVETASQSHREADHRVATARGKLDAAERSLLGARREVFEVLRTSILWSAGPDSPPDLEAPDLDERIAAVVDHWAASGPDIVDPDAAKARVRAHREKERLLEARLAALDDGAAPDPAAISDETLEKMVRALDEAQAELDAAVDAAVAAQREVRGLVERIPKVRELEESLEALEREATQLGVLAQVMRGDRFVEYVANDHLTELATRASDHLATLTDGRYALALDEETGFEIVDHHGGGAVRPVHTLSGGESFLTALSLALALSTQVQARSARPLGFFFLDEGFGTLDPEALERVMSSIERLRDESRVIGLISHVPSIRERVPRYLWVHRPDETGGSSVELRDN